MISVSASAVISVSPPTILAYPFVAPKTRPWARNGAGAGIRNVPHRKKPAPRHWSSGLAPAGLECGLHLARRGYQVTLSEASDQLGGRVRGESSLKGLSAWGRVEDYRTYALKQLSNVDIYLDSKVTAEMAGELGISNIFLATGSHWRTDGPGRSSRAPIAGLDQPGSINIMTPEQIMAGQTPAAGPIVIYDDDQIYLAGVIADHLSSNGHEVIFVTPASVVSPWTDYTLEQERIQSSLLEQNVRIVTGRMLSKVNDHRIETRCIYTGASTEIDCSTLLLVTERTPDTALYEDLLDMQEQDESKADWHIELIGDALAPGLIADAIFSGHLAAENFQDDPERIEQALYRREIPSLIHDMRG